MVKSNIEKDNIYERKYLLYEVLVFPFMLMIIYILVNKYIYIIDNYNDFNVLKKLFFSIIIIIILESFIFYEKRNDYNIKRLMIFMFTFIFYLIFKMFYLYNSLLIIYLWLYFFISISSFMMTNIRINDHTKANYVAIFLILLFALFFFTK